MRSKKEDPGVMDPRMEEEMAPVQEGTEDGLACKVKKASSANKTLSL